MKFEFSVVKGGVTQELIHSRMEACIDIVREAYLAHGARHSVNPDSYFLKFPEKPGCRIIALPAYLGERFDVSGIKWIASYPENIHKGFPRASAVLVLNSYETGYPFAVLEASIISAARTASSAVLAAEWLHGRQKRARRIGFIGNGLIARYIYNFFLGSGWKAEGVALFDTQPGESVRFAQQVVRASEHQEVTLCTSAEELVRGCDLVVLATVAAQPHLHDPALLAHRPTLLNISLRDLAPALLLASNNVVDDVDHVLKQATSPHLTEQQVGHRGFINGTLADVVSGRAKLDPDRPSIFSPFGLGVLDLAVGKWVFDEARASGRLVTFDDFFADLTR